MRVIADHKLRIPYLEASPIVRDLIREALTIPNMERQKMMEQGIDGWQNLPEHVELWSRDFNRDHLVMPRGFESALRAGLDLLGIDTQFIDETVFEELPAQGSPIELRPWQEQAVLAVLHSRNGIWKAPAGSGKTVGILEAIRCLNCPSIVLVNTKDILYQWIERAKQFLGEEFPVGVIGDGKFQISDYLTIATVQTLSSRFEVIKEHGFFEQFSFVCLDECHHATANTYREIVDQFSARYRIGVSATPDKTGDFALATNVLGPIIHETHKKDVNTLVEPIIFRIPTEFEFAYRGKIGRRPSNYPQLIQSLVVDEHRNALIVKSILMNAGSHSLVVSKRLEHLEILKIALSQLNHPDPVYMLTGKESSVQREITIQLVSEKPSVMLSTLADEALDIPRLDCLFLIFPQRNTGLIEQQVGRVARQHPDKIGASVFDFCDPRVGPLEAQWQVRRRDVYQKNGYEIKTVIPKQIIEFKGE